LNTLADQENVCFWPEADAAKPPIDVRFQGMSGHHKFTPSSPLVTPLRHCIPEQAPGLPGFEYQNYGAGSGGKYVGWILRQLQFRPNGNDMPLSALKQYPRSTS
jgi:hypothetical protein